MTNDFCTMQEVRGIKIPDSFLAKAVMLSREVSLDFLFNYPLKIMPILSSRLKNLVRYILSFYLLFFSSIAHSNTIFALAIDPNRSSVTFHQVPNCYPNPQSGIEKCEPPYIEYKISGLFDLTTWDTDNEFASNSQLQNISVTLDPSSQVPWSFPEYPARIEGTLIHNRYDNTCPPLPPGMYYACAIWINGMSDAFSGSFDGSILSITGTTGISYFFNYYTYTIVASAIPLPGSLFLLLSGLPLLAVVLRRQLSPRLEK